MKVQNNSIIITCDGFYLISLNGYFSQELSLRLLYRKGREPLFSLNMVKIVDSVTVAYLRFKDKVYLNMTTQNASCEDIQVNGGELILIHQNPGGFCVYWGPDGCTQARNQHEGHTGGGQDPDSSLGVEVLSQLSPHIWPREMWPEADHSYPHSGIFKTYFYIPINFMYLSCIF